MIRLVRLHRSRRDEFLRYAREFQKAGEPAIGCAADDPEAYFAEAERLSRRVESPGSHVQTFEYWALDGSRIVASCRVRPLLSPETEREGGHVSFEVRPSDRGRGLGAVILQLALVESARFDLRRILLTTAPDNQRAMRVIERHGGRVLDLATSPADGRTVVRFGVRLGGAGADEYGESVRDDDGWGEGSEPVRALNPGAGLDEDPVSLAVLFARDTSRAVILRRGPSRWVRSILWDRADDGFEDGQWFQGRVIVRDSALSPDGQRLLYAAADARSDDTTHSRWTAISRPPWFTALALIPGGRGGAFLDDRRFVAYGAAGRRDAIGADPSLTRVDVGASGPRPSPLSSLPSNLLPHNFGTRGGLLFRRLSGGGTESIRDFSAMEFEPLRAPYDDGQRQPDPSTEVLG